MATKGACHPVRPSSSDAGRDHLAVARSSAAISASTDGENDPEIALFREREIIPRCERRPAIGARLRLDAAETAGLDVHRSRSTSAEPGFEPARDLAAGAAPAVMPVAAEMLVALVALVE